MQNRTSAAKLLCLAAAAGAMLFAGAPSKAQLFTASGTGIAGRILGASANFTVFSDRIEILFKNTSTDPVVSNPDVLTGLFFDVSGSPIIGDTAAHRLVALAGASAFVRASSPGTLANEWGFRSNMGTVNPKSPNNSQYGVSASGLGGLFGAGNSFGGVSNSPQGVDYGLVGVLSGSPAGGLQHNLIDDSVLIKLFAKTGTTLSAQNTIGHVWFQWGSNVSGEPGFPGVPPSGPPSSVPEPGTLAMCVGVVVPVLGLLRRSRKA